VTAVDDKIVLGGASPAPGGADVSGAHRAERVTRMRARLRPAAGARAARALFEGASVTEGPWPSLAEVWKRHAEAAGYLAWPALRWLRYAWGGLHIAETCVTRTWEWSGYSPAKRLGLIAVTAAVLWLLHVI